MPIRAFGNTLPTINETAYVAPEAVVIGDVDIGAHTSIWPATVIRGDVNRIRIGNNTSIQDGSVIHVTHESELTQGGFATHVGHHVTVGHKVLLHGCTIEDACLIGMGSILMDGAHVESQVLIAAGSLVPPGKVCESGYLWVGSPVKKIRKLTDEELDFIEYSALHYVRLKDRYMS